MNQGLYGYPRPVAPPFVTSRVSSVSVIGDGQRMAYVRSLGLMAVLSETGSASAWLLRTRDQQLHKKIAIGGNTAALCYCPGDGLLYVASVSKLVRTIRPGDGSTVSTIDLTALGGTSFYLCYVPTSNLMVIADHATSAPRVIDVATAAVTGSIATASGKGLAFVSSMNRVVTSWTNFVVMDAAARSVSASYAKGGDGAIVYAPKVDRCLLCTGESTLTKVNPNTGATDATLDLAEGTANNPLCYCPENGLVYVAAGDPGVIYAIDPATLSIVASVATNGYVHGLCYSPDNRAVWGVHDSEPRGWMVSIDTHRIIGTFVLP